MISEKMYRLGSKRSCIRELFEYGKKAAAEIGAENVFDYSLGNPSTPPPKIVDETIEKILKENPSCAVHGYTSAQGSVECRKAIADDLEKRFGAGITPDRIYMTCGAAASLCITLRALTGECDVNSGEVIALAPYFPEYRVFVEAAGAKFKAVPCNDDFKPDIAAIRSKINKNTLAIIINSPNNPSGAVFPESSLRELAKLLTERAKRYGHPIYIISDEPYREITFGADVPFMPTLYNDTVVCYSFSKSLSLPGERIGYIAVPPKASRGDKLYAAICGAGRALGYVCAPALMQKMIASCCGETSDFTVYKENRDTLYSALTAMGYSCVMPEGAFYLFVKSPVGDAGKFSELAKKFGLLIVPSDDFGCKGYVRLAYCVDPQMIRRSLPAFAKLMDEAKKISE